MEKTSDNREWGELRYMMRRKIMSYELRLGYPVCLQRGAPPQFHLIVRFDKIYQIP